MTPLNPWTNIRARKIALDLSVIEYPGCENLPLRTLLVPFVIPLSLNQSLPAGTYEITLGRFSEGELLIQRAAPMTEDRLDPAFVETVTILKTESQNHVIELEGVHLDSCWDLAQPISSPQQGTVFVIIPKRTVRQDCASSPVRRRWKTTIKLPEELERKLGTNSGPVLVHVRTLESHPGSAPIPKTINSVIFSE